MPTYAFVFRDRTSQTLRPHHRYMRKSFCPGDHVTGVGAQRKITTLSSGDGPCASWACRKEQPKTKCGPPSDSWPGNTIRIAMKPKTRASEPVCFDGLLRSRVRSTASVPEHAEWKAGAAPGEVQHDYARGHS